ncbi:hypothetical protein [Kitasatospora sp. NPDC090091]|uniref:hypothetical protein n=1 Tax=Kitasatospora sp. NPDC090091 TaxID=3364081 RepID=UPI0037FD4D1C
MAGFRVTVCLPAEAGDDLAPALAQAMAPFEQYGRSPWRGIWEWWTIRGGSDGTGFRVRPGFHDDTRLIHDDPAYDGQPLPSTAGMCAGGPRGLLDLADHRAMSGRMAAVRARAADPWDLWHRLVAEHPPFLPLSVLAARHAADPQAYPLQRMFADFESQPLLQAFTSHPASQIPELGLTFTWQRNQAHFAETGLNGAREDFAERITDLFRQPDVLTLDGWWIEGGATPVHGTCDDAESCPHLAVGQRYRRDLGGYLDTLPDDVLLVTLKCRG